MCLPDNRKQDASLLYLLHLPCRRRVSVRKNVDGLLENPEIFADICTHLRIA